jgi:hypothetical protein
LNYELIKDHIVSSKEHQSINMNFPTTRDNLFIKLQSMNDQQIDQYKIIEYLYKVTDHYGIRIRHDHHYIPTVSKLPVSLTRQKDGKHTLTIGQNNIPVIGRIVLSGDRNNDVRGRGIPLYSECNGLVIDARTWKILAVPPNALNNYIPMKIVDGYLGKNLYDIISVDDGTILTIYHWDHPIDGPTWALSSSNAYDVSTLTWIGTLTYAEIFNDLIMRLYPDFAVETGMTLEKNGRLNFSKLDTNYCYTVGIRHHNFHPMVEDPERVWQIQSAKTDETLPQISFKGNLPVIPQQRIYEFKEPITIKTLRAIGNNSIMQAEEYIASQSKQPNVINYGWILRSRDPSQTKEHSDFLVETPLLKRVRKIVYERGPKSISHLLTAEDRLEYNAMRAFLTATERSEFLALYPKWAPKFQVYDEFVKNVIQIIIYTISQRTLVKRSPIIKTPTSHIAHMLLEHISLFEKLTAFHKDTASIVRDYVVNPEYAFLFLQALKN